MIREILGSNFMDYRKVHQLCRQEGLSQSAIRSIKREEGIKTVQVTNSKGESLWLWYDPDQIWEKYGE